VGGGDSVVVVGVLGLWQEEGLDLGEELRHQWVLVGELF
jgi:hypothetical protein